MRAPDRAAVAALETALGEARRARDELTWDGAARAHLAIYEEIA